MKIPENANPYRVIVNGVSHAYEAGEETTVAPGVEELINAANNFPPAAEEVKPPFAGGGGGGLPAYTSDDSGKVLSLAATEVPGTVTLIDEQTVTTNNRCIGTVVINTDHLIYPGDTVHLVVDGAASDCVATEAPGGGSLVIATQVDGSAFKIYISGTSNNLFGDVKKTYTVSATVEALAPGPVGPAWVSGGVFLIGSTVKSGIVTLNKTFSEIFNAAKAGKFCVIYYDSATAVSYMYVDYVNLNDGISALFYVTDGWGHLSFHADTPNDYPTAELS